MKHGPTSTRQITIISLLAMLCSLSGCVLAPMLDPTDVDMGGPWCGPDELSERVYTYGGLNWMLVPRGGQARNVRFRARSVDLTVWADNVETEFDDYLRQHNLDPTQDWHSRATVVCVRPVIIICTTSRRGESEDYLRFSTHLTGEGPLLWFDLTNGTQRRELRGV